MATIILSYEFAKIVIMLCMAMVATIVLGSAGMIQNIFRKIRRLYRGH